MYAYLVSDATDETGDGLNLMRGAEHGQQDARDDLDALHAQVQSRTDDGADLNAEGYLMYR